MAVLCDAVEAENEFRRSANAAIPSEAVGVKWGEVVEGRREECQLGGSAESARYSAVVLDAKAEMGAVEHECAVFIVPQVSSILLIFSSSLLLFFVFQKCF